MVSMGDREVQLIRIIDKVSVRALLVSLAEKHLMDFKTLWQSKMTLADEDQYWDWQRKQQIYLSSSNPMFEGYAVECEKKTQGMMILKVGGERSRVEPDRKIVSAFYRFFDLSRKTCNLKVLHVSLNSFRLVRGTSLLLAFIPALFLLR
jgi:hypothetical protein